MNSLKPEIHNKFPFLVTHPFQYNYEITTQMLYRKKVLKNYHLKSLIFNNNWHYKPILYEKKLRSIPKNTLESKETAVNKEN